jgi:hypothetical protein
MKFKSLDLGHLVTAAVAYQVGKSGKSETDAPQPLTPEERKLYSGTLLASAGILVGFLALCVTAPLTGLQLYPFNLSSNKNTAVSKTDSPQTKAQTDATAAPKQSTWHLYPFK